MDKVTEACASGLSRPSVLWLRKLGDDWKSIAEITAAANLGVRSRSGVANTLSRLAMAGYAEWVVFGEPPMSHYRLTEAGRAALSKEKG